ncbi:hypothetical protein NC652_030448 [Populus alba x Populus x berolinensis]|nr:hypothetical protein NC652_030448 [Populus alba x Populus x berolinensis]
MGFLFPGLIGESILCDHNTLWVQFSNLLQLEGINNTREDDKPYSQKFLSSTAIIFFLTTRSNWFDDNDEMITPKVGIKTF